jgi:hypothetical protein
MCGRGRSMQGRVALECGFALQDAFPDEPCHLEHHSVSKHSQVL